MIIRQLSIDEFYALFAARVAYGSEAFCRLNADKAEAVRFFAGYESIESAPCMGVALGLKRGEWHAPFSAPFGEIAYAKAPTLQQTYDFASELKETLGGAPVHITLAPQFYDTANLPIMAGVLANYAQRTVWEYNFHFTLDQLDNYEATLGRSARYNLHKALASGFQCCEASLERAYAVIKANRESHGYYLSMTLQQVLDTAQVLPAHGMVLSRGGEDVASAIVFGVTEDVAQVIYWGDAPGYAKEKPMNLLPLRVFEYCRRQGYGIVDCGTASTGGVPNVGLCDFKKSVGCALTIKPSFVL